jgi:2-C-methyl-D-erythritol 4-phosphate cytidylyltransferase
MPKGKAAAILLAGGVGSRLGQGTRKTNLRLGRQSMLRWSLKSLLALPELAEISLVLHPEDIQRHKSWQPEGPSRTIIHLCAGGRERQDSVAQGLAAIQGAWPLLLVHDGARPFLKPALVRDCLKVAAHRGGAVACVPSKDSIKLKENGGLKNLQRDKIFVAQTPQAYRLSAFREAHAKAQRMKRYFTDEASLMEWQGQASYPVMAYYENFKVTTPDDLIQARRLIRHFHFGK